MDGGLLGLLAGVLAVIVGVWKLFGRKNREKRKRAEEGQKLFEEGAKEDDPSKITAGFSRIKRDS